MKKCVARYIQIDHSSDLVFIHNRMIWLQFISIWLFHCIAYILSPGSQAPRPSLDLAHELTQILSHLRGKACGRDTCARQMHRTDMQSGREGLTQAARHAHERYVTHTSHNVSEHMSIYAQHLSQQRTWALQHKDAYIRSFNFEPTLLLGYWMMNW